MNCIGVATISGTMLRRRYLLNPLGFGAGDSNLYRYVANGPTKSIDPSGEELFALTAAAAAGAKQTLRDYGIDAEFKQLLGTGGSTSVSGLKAGTRKSHRIWLIGYWVKRGDK